jgi:hypothetical protein
MSLELAETITDRLLDDDAQSDPEWRSAFHTSPCPFPSQLRGTVLSWTPDKSRIKQP